MSKGQPEHASLEDDDMEPHYQGKHLQGTYGFLEYVYRYSFHHRVEYCHQCHHHLILPYDLRHCPSCLLSLLLVGSGHGS